jgi:hypothetical protein
VAVVLAVTGDHDELARPRALQAGDLLGVAAQLHERGGLGAAGELGVRHVVRPRPEARGHGDLEEEVGVAAPAPVEERGLEHHVDAGPHEAQRLRLGRQQRLGRRARHRHLADREAGGPEPLELVALVLVAATSEDVELRVVLVGPGQLTVDDPPVELGGVRAGEVGDEVARAQDGAGGGPVHGPPIVPRGCDASGGPRPPGGGPGPGSRAGLAPLRDHVVDQAVALRLVGGEPAVAVGVGVDGGDVLAAVEGDPLRHDPLDVDDLLGLDGDVAAWPATPAEGWCIMIRAWGG